MKFTELPKDENSHNRIQDLGHMSLSASEVLVFPLSVQRAPFYCAISPNYAPIGFIMILT
jgi:hypothetical protein